QVLGAHAAGLRALGAEVTIVAGRGRAAAGTRLARIPELDSRHPAVLRDFAAPARGEVTPGHAALADRIERRPRTVLAKARRAGRVAPYPAGPLLVPPARLPRRKRVEGALAATRAPRGRGRDAALVVTGPPGPHTVGNRRYLEELTALARDAPGVHLLHALGIRAPYRLVADLYALADALVLPSANEGFGIPLLEAALHRLPIVCSDLAALRAVGGDAATYVPADASGDVIADAIVGVLDTPAARLRSGARALAWP